MLALSDRLTIVVQKYGGSSVADPEKIQQVARHVAATRDSGLSVVVVVSAMGKTTENLLSLARSLAPEPPRRELDMLVSTGERVTGVVARTANGPVSLHADLVVGADGRHSTIAQLTSAPEYLATECSRAGDPSWPRKYFWATMLVAF